MLPRLLRTRALLRYGGVTGRYAIARRTLVAAPKAGDGPLMERRPDRELPGTHPHEES
jgi:cytochrome c oxidase assembly factor 1